MPKECCVVSYLCGYNGLKVVSGAFAWAIFLTFANTVGSTDRVKERTTDETFVCDKVLPYESPGSDVQSRPSEQHGIRIELNTTHFYSGSSVKVKTTSNQRITRLILHARSPEVSTSPVGTWTTTGTGSVYSCGANADTFSYFSTNTSTVSVAAVWHAPSAYHQNNIRFVGSVYPSEDPATVFNISSVSLKKGHPELDLSSCGNTKGCYRYATNTRKCHADQTQCEYIFTYQLNTPRDQVSVELSARAAWVAIGFSSDDKMAGDDVLLCKGGDDGGSVDHYYTHTAYHPPTKQKSNPLKNHEVYFTDGDRITCRFTRDLKVYRDEKSVDLNNDWFHLYAWGNLTSGGKLQRHFLPKAPTSPDKRTLFKQLDEISAAVSSHNVFKIVHIVVIVKLCHAL